jgi:hypothetical protein
MLARILWEVAIVIGIGDLYLLAERFNHRHRRRQWVDEQVKIQMSRNGDRHDQHRRGSA